ncbi:MAG TPA: acyltransferase [Candidatus Acidoferrum sp.]
MTDTRHALAEISSPARNSQPVLRLPNPPELSRSVSAHLDFIRSVAAWAVMWGHLRAFFFVDFQNLSHPSIFLKVLYFVTGFGHDAVIIFFVLSGFLISSSILKSRLAGKWSWAEYATARAARLYVVLIPGLLFGTLWDVAGKHLFSASGLYSNPLASFGGLVVQNELTLRNFLGNLFFLQTIVCHTYGSNGPLWSIANEFWYYVLFPLGLSVTLAWKRKRFATVAAMTLLALVIIWMLGIAKMIGFGIWLAGFVVVLAWSRTQRLVRGSRLAYLLASGTALATSLYLARTMRITPPASEVAIGVTFAAFVFGTLQLDFRLHLSAVYLRGARLFAGFSYSLYVLHFPFLLFLRAWLAPRERWQPDAMHLIYGLAIGFTALLFSWLIALGTEYQTGAARNALREFFGIRKPLRSAGRP